MLVLLVNYMLCVWVLFQILVSEIQHYRNDHCYYCHYYYSVLCDDVCFQARVCPSRLYYSALNCVIMSVFRQESSPASYITRELTVRSCLFSGEGLPQPATVARSNFKVGPSGSAFICPPSVLVCCPHPHLCNAPICRTWPQVVLPLMQYPRLCDISPPIHPTMQ